MATIVARYCRKTNQLQSVQGYGRQRTHKIIYKSKKLKKSVAMAILVARYCRKTNQLQSVQGFGMQRTHKKIFKPKKHEKVLPSTHKSQFEKQYRKSISWQKLLPKTCKKHHHYSCSSPCKKYIPKILVKIFAWILFIKIPPI